MKEKTPGDIYLILDNIRSIHNVGSIFRTAACAGVKKIVLCGYTPEPKDRFGRWRNDFAKVALGGEREVPYQVCATIEDAVALMREKDIRVVAVEQDTRAISLKYFEPTYPVAYMLGNEVDGISQSVLDSVDEIVEIPLRGDIKESLNVSVVAGILMFDIT